MFTLPLIINTITLIGGGLTLNSGFKYLGLYLKINNLATSKIKSLAAGEIEVGGVVTQLSQQHYKPSPLTNINSCAFEFEVTKQIKHGKKSKTVVVYKESYCQPFYLKKNNSYIYVDPTDAEIYNDSFTKKRTSEGLIENLHNLSKKKKYTYKEKILPIGEEVFILGYTSILEHPPENVNRLKISKIKNKDFIITDEGEFNFKQRTLFASIFLFLIGTVLIFWSIIQFITILNWISYLGGL